MIDSTVSVYNCDLFPQYLCLNSQTVFSTLEDQGLKEMENLFVFLHYSLAKAARRQCKLGALRPGVCSVEGGGRIWLPFLQRHSVFNPSKTILLWPHTGASDSKASAAWCRAAAEPHLPFFCWTVDLFKIQSFNLSLAEFGE